jgi:hypothetical protein
MVSLDEDDIEFVGEESKDNNVARAVDKKKPLQTIKCSALCGRLLAGLIHDTSLNNKYN